MIRFIPWLIVAAVASAGTYKAVDAWVVAPLERKVAALEGERDTLQNKVKDQKARIADFAATNERLDRQLQEAGRINAEIARQNVVLETNLADARRRFAEQKRATELALDQLKRREESVYASSTECRDWAAAPVCGPVSDLLRDHWRLAAGADPDRSGGDREAGTGPGGRSGPTGVAPSPPPAGVPGRSPER